MGGNEFEEIESDVFRAARSGVEVAGFHKSLSEHVAKGDGIGSTEMVATYGWPQSPGEGGMWRGNKDISTESGLGFENF